MSSASVIPVLNFNYSRVYSCIGGCALAAGTSACGASLPGPALTEHPSESYVEVPYPPSAALAETVPARPDVPGVVWIDGGWTFRGKSYAWQRGGWFIAPRGGKYAASRIVYLEGGRLMFAPGTWYDVNRQPLPRERAVAPAYTPPNDVTSEFQTGR